MDSSVVSCPPCIDPVLVNNPNGLSVSAPFNQSPDVESRKYLSAAAMLPNRVGLPSSRPSQPARSSRVANGGPESGIGPSTASVVDETGGTVRTMASAPAASAPRAANRASSAVRPLSE